MSNPRKFGSRQSRVISMGLASLLLMACCVQWATGQGAPPEYYAAPYDPSFMTKDDKTGEIKLNEKGVKQATFVKNQVLIGSVPYAAESKDQFKKWYTGFQFRGFSQIDQLHKLPERRKEIVEDLRRAKSKEIHDELLAMTDQYMKVYVTAPRNFHPAVRFNAMLVIGDLNAEEQGIALRYANPMPAALDFMLTEYQRPTQLDAVRLAAMIGILRHSQLTWARPEPLRIAAPQQQQIAQLMLALINAKDPPSGRSREGHVWMQRRAVEILATLKLVGTSDPVTQAVTGLVRDHGADMTLRCTAAEALGKTSVIAPTKSKLDATRESLQLAALLVEACHQELDRIEAWQKKKMQGTMDPSGGFGDGGTMSGSGGMMPGGGMMSGGSSGAGMPGGGGSSRSGMDGGMSGGLFGGAGGEGSGIGMEAAGPKDPLVELFRRQIKHEIECVRKGIGGVGRLVSTDPRKPAFPELSKDVDAVWKATDPLANTLPSLHKSIKDSLKSLEIKTAALLPKPKAPAPEEPESDEPTAVPAVAPGAAAPGAAAPGAAAPGAAAPGAVAPGAVAPGAVAPGAVAPGGAAAPGAAAPAVGGGGTSAPPSGAPARP